MHGWWAMFAYGLVIVALIECLAALPRLVRATWDAWFPASEAAWQLTHGRWTE